MLTSILVHNTSNSRGPNPTHSSNVGGVVRVPAAPTVRVFPVPFRADEHQWQASRANSQIGPPIEEAIRRKGK